ncbi:MAG: hypothetical protein NC347_11610 [Clostridium sp.]|nr:hypothetical protein [Clostridium sp.]
MEQIELQIRKFVCRVRSRLREQSIVDYLPVMVEIGLGIGIVLSLVSLAVPFYYAVPMAVIIAAASFLMGLVLGIRKTPTMKQSALLADSKGHKEKISTALYLEGKEDVFAVLQKKDALRIVNQFEIKKEFPLRVSGKRFAVVLALAVLFVVSSCIDTPARDRAAAKHEVTKDIKKEIAKLDKVEKQIKENREIPEHETKEIEKQLEMAKKELKESKSQEELTKTKKRMNKKMEMAAEKTGNKTLSETLQKAAAESEEQDFQEKQELAKEAEEALEKAKNGGNRDKKEAYEKLSELSGKLSDEELKNAAEAYKEAQQSDLSYAAAQSALQNAMQRMNQDSRNLASGNNENQLTGTNQSNSTNNQNNQSNNGNNNQSQSAGQNGNQNNASGTPDNNQQNGNQSGLAGGQNSGSGNGSGGGWNRGSKEGKEGAAKTGENITVPDGELGNDENLIGKANGNNTGTKEKSNQSQAWSGNKISYGEVSAQYKKKAYKKIEGSNYPGKMKDKIKNYFDGLN